MKKLLTSVLLLALGMNAFAQDEEFASYNLKETDIDHVMPTHFMDNWFVGVYAGTAQSWGSFTSKTSFLKKLQPTFSLTVGKAITPVNEIRMMVNFGRNTGDTEIGKLYHFNTWGLYFDWLPNLTNLFLGYRENRRVNFKALVGIGGEISAGFSGRDWNPVTDKVDEVGKPQNAYYNTRQTSLVDLRLGLGMSIRLNDKLKLNIEAVENMLDDSRDGIQDEKNGWDGHLNLMVGVTYHFKNADKARQFSYVRRDLQRYEPLIKEAEDLRAKADDAERKPIIIENHQQVDKQVIYTMISFDPEETDVERLQQTNVYTTAQTWKQLPEADIYIVNASKKNDKTFRKRAESIKDVLSDRWQIPEKQIKVEANEADVLTKYISRHYIIFIINE